MFWLKGYAYISYDEAPESDAKVDESQNTLVLKIFWLPWEQMKLLEQNGEDTGFIPE